MSNRATVKAASRVSSGSIATCDVIVWCVLALCLTISACSAPKQELLSEQLTPGLPPLPAAGAPESPHTTTALSTVIPGSSYVAAAGDNAKYAGGVLRLLPWAGEPFAYAMYTLDNLAIERPVQLDCYAEPDALHPGGEDDLPASYWIGLSDYSDYTWEWRGPYTGPISLALNGPELRERYLSATGSFSYLVLVADQDLADPYRPGVRLTSAVTQSADVSAAPGSYYTNRPHYPLLSGISAGPPDAGRAVSALDPTQYVTLNWEHVRDPGAEDNEALAVRVYRSQAGSTDKQPIGTVFSEDGGYTDPLDNSESASAPLPGETYTYSTRAFNEGGWTSYSAGLAITIPPDPPANVRASDGQFADQIELRWDKAHGADGYRIYRDSTESLLAEVGDVDVWVDTGVEGSNAHTYWVIARLGELQSRFGEPDSGFAGLPEPSEWFMFGANQRHAGHLSQIIGPNVDELMWSAPLGAVFGAPAIAVNGVIYAASADNHLYCVNGDATINWDFATADVLITSPAIAPDNTVYLAGNDGILYALSAEGELTWQFAEAAGFELSSPCVTTAGTVYFGSANGKLYAVNAQGERMWAFDAKADFDDGGQSGILSSPALSPDGDVVVGSRNNCLYSIYADSGLKHWRYLTDGDVDSSPCINQAGLIFVGSRDGYLHAVLPNGSNLWSFPTGDGIIASPAINPVTGDVVIGSLDNRVYCVEDTTGEEVWNRLAGDDFFCSAALDALGNTYIANKDGRIYAYDPGGSLLWSYSTAPAFGIALGPDGSVYCGTLGALIRIGPGL